MPPTKKINRNCAVHPDRPGTFYPHKVKHPLQLAQWLCEDCWEAANTDKLDLMKLQRGELADHR